MKKNKKVSKKKVKKTKKVKPRQNKTTKHEIVVRVETPQSKPLTSSDLMPQVEGGKYMIPKTWVSEKQVIRLVQRTPAQFVKTRKGRGGMMFDYVPGHYFKRVLNFTFGWNWDFKIINQEVFGLGEGWGQVITRGELTVKDDLGHAITKEDNGKADIKYLKGTKTPMDLGNDFKASSTDCLKRCAAQLGIASDVYGRGEVRQDIGEEIKADVVQGEVKLLPPATETKAPKIEAECHSCGNPMTKAEAEYSKKMFKKQLCRGCQAEAKRSK